MADFRAIGFMLGDERTVEESASFLPVLHITFLLFLLKDANRVSTEV